jgi:hypothetical protein
MVFTTEVPDNELLVEDLATITDDDKLKKTIEDWYEKTRTQGMKLGAQMICVAGEDILKKHLTKKSKPSLRDYERATAELIKLFSVPLKQITEQNNSGESHGKESSI